MSLRFPGNEYNSECLASCNHVLMYVVSKTLLRNQEWSLIFKHNIFCLYWIPVSIVFNSDTTLKNKLNDSEDSEG